MALDIVTMNGHEGIHSIVDQDNAKTANERQRGSVLEGVQWSSRLREGRKSPFRLGLGRDGKQITVRGPHHSRPTGARTRGSGGRTTSRRHLRNYTST
jgi:hypothetical protein